MQIRSGQNYTRREALKDLMKAENDKEQAVDNFKMITDSLMPEESLRDATQGFINILEAVGNRETDYSRDAYRQVDSRVKGGEGRAEGLASFEDMIHSENSKDDVPGNFSTVDKAVDKGFGRAESTEEFDGLLSQVGTRETKAARSGFSLVVENLREGEHLSEGLDEFRKIISAENSLDDVESGFQLIDNSLQRDESRSNGTQSYLNLMGTLGARETSTVQNAYRKVQERVLAGEDRSITTEAFISGIRAENQEDDYFANFDAVTRAVERGMDRTEVTEQFEDLLGRMGVRESEDVRDHFRVVLDSLKKDEELGNGLNSHRQILNAENDFDQVKSGYQLVDSVVNETITREAATEYYVSLLQEYGARDTDGAQKAFRETAELILG